jgi:uncharacterized membrane protein
VPEKPPLKHRIDAIDIARGIALLAMAIYHFTWDLGFFGYVEPGMATTGGWKIFARCIASSFLFLAGVSLFLAHADGVRWSGYWRRLAMVAGAALAISAATYIATPSGFIFFGILHQIALASLLGLAFLRLPALLTLAVAVLVVAAPQFLRSEFFDPPWWWWTGLSQSLPRSNDYVPVFPWFGAVLAGLAAAKIARQTGLISRLAEIHAGRWARPAIFAGRHSLAVYLIHQPVLIACVWAFAQIMPPAPETREVQFLRSCQAACNETRDTEFCTRYCACMIDRLERDKLIDGVFAGDEDADLRAKVEKNADLCTVETDNAILEGGLE